MTDDRVPRQSDTKARVFPPASGPRPVSARPVFAIGDGATTAVESLAETMCFADRHAHTATHPACAVSRRRADRILALLSVSRRRSLAVGEYLVDRAVRSITAAIEKASL